MVDIDEMLGSFRSVYCAVN